ncbi:MAG: hypothetical protein P8X69_10680 [Maritimibacter sp.]
MTKLSQEARRAAKTAWRERKQDWVICAVRKLEEDLSPLARERIGEERLKYWSAQLSARIF